MYPGQEYWHRLNPNIRRAEENWMKSHGPVDGIAVVYEKNFLPLPPLPEEAWKFIEDMQGLAQRATLGLSDGKDAGTNTQRES